MPQITVIVPVYKVEPYLRRCVDSILNQSFTDFELVLVDDGSPDGCGAICDEYAAADSRVHVIHQENGGLSAARNAGIDRAFADSDSEWLAFVDSDDWVHPQYLALLHAAALENHTAISICAYRETAAFDGHFPPMEKTRAEVADALTFYTERNLIATVAWNKLYRKELFAQYRYPVGKVHEDEFLTYKLLHRAGKIAYIGQELYAYFVNDAGITRRPFSLSRFDGTEALYERIAYVRPLGNRELLKFSINYFLYNALDMIRQMRASDAVSPEQKKQKEKALRKQVRRVLLRYGWRFFPIRQHYDPYEFAFPHLIPFMRRCAQPLKKLTALLTRRSPQ